MKRRLSTCLKTTFKLLDHFGCKMTVSMTGQRGTWLRKPLRKLRRVV